MKRPSQMNVLWTFVACLLTTVRTRSVAYMDLQTRSANFTGCGDTLKNTISGQVSSEIPPSSPDLNCSLALFSPPGTRLSLTVTEVKLSNGNFNTCGGNRLEILGSNTEGAMSLLPTFPLGLCGYVKPSQPIESTDNQVFLTLRSVKSTAASTFSITYTAFKTEPDGSCYECYVSGSRDTQFCINQSLVCDGEQNCPAVSNSEENDLRCSASTPSPAGTGVSITVIVIIVILLVVLLAIIIFTILALMAKRVRSKRARNSVRRPQRPSQSRPGNPAQVGGGPPRQQRRPTPDSRHQGRVSTGAPTFTTEGEYTGLDFTERSVADHPRDAPSAVVIRNPAGAPPPYSTLPRPYEESLQMATGTTPTSRSHLASISNDLENN